MAAFLFSTRAFLWVLLCLFGTLTASHGTTLHPHDFARSKTRFELDRYFEGRHSSWGVFENTDGSPRRYFTCENRGNREKGGDLKLTQRFNFSNGKKQTRTWFIHRLDATHWQATANDMVGIAIGEGQGNAFFWEYDITLNAKNPVSTFHIRQWMYQPEGTTNLMTRLVITKLGVTVGEVTEMIHPASVAR